MFWETTKLQKLAQRATQGDQAALIDLRRELEPQLLHIVRYVLRTRDRSSARARCILAVEAQLSETTRDHRAGDKQWVSLEVTRRICDSVIAKLKAGRLNAPAALETVCN